MRPMGEGAAVVFRRLAIRRIPGFERQGFELGDLAAGVNVIHGPNASGKSSTARALRLLLWPPEGPEAVGVSVAGTGTIGERSWLVDLDHGRVEHQEAGARAPAPALPPAAHADRYRLALHELLQAEAGGEELARQVAREALGGYDLDAALEAVGARRKPTYSRAAAEAYRAADAAVRRCQDELAALERESEGLDALRRELDRAREAKRRLEEVKAILDWLDWRQRLAEAERRMAALPRALSRLTGKELEELRRLDAGLTESEEERSAALRRLERARQALGSARIPPEGLPQARLDEIQAKTRRLAELERDGAAAERELAGARERRETARNALGDRASEEVLERVGEGSWRELAELARKGERLAARRERLRDEEESLAGALDGSGEDGSEAPAGGRGPAGAAVQVDRLARGAALLRRWLRLSRHAGRRAAIASVAVVLLGTAGAAGAELVDPGAWGLTAIAGLLALWLVLHLAAERRRRHSTEERFVALGLDPPVRWDGAAVEESLEALERRLEGHRARATLAEERDRLRRERRAAVQRSRRELEGETEALRAERAELLERLGLAPVLDPDLEPAPQVALAQALGAWREAHGEVRQREAELQELRAQRGRLLTALRDALEGYGLPAPEDGDGASAALGRLKELLRDHGEVLRIEGEGGELARIEARIERARREREELFQALDLEPGDVAGLQGLLDRLGTYREARDAGETARAGLEAAAERLPGPPPDDRPPGELRRELEEARDTLREDAERIEPLIRRIQDLETRIGRAKGQRALEDALAERDRALHALARDRERVAAGVVRHELGEWLKGQVRARHRPAVLRRASELFATVTRGRYRLLDPTGDRPVFRAWESATDRGRSLDELSSGTRLQLLVAVRLAFIEVHERGVRPPLILDETLANCDDASAQALIETVVEVARAGRQVFYFTAQSDEVARFRAHLEAPFEGREEAPEWAVVDLARVRRLEEARQAPLQPWEPPAPEIPAPDGLDRRAYGERLGVPGIDPRRGPGAVHLWHLVEEPQVLHRLLVRRVERWGELQTLAGVGGGGPGGSAHAGAVGDGAGAELLGGGEQGGVRWRRALARGRCIEALCRAWREGRGRPVDRGVLLESGAVSETFIDEVAELAAELDGSAGDLVGALREGRVKRFLTRKVDELEAYLEREGYLVAGRPLSRAELRDRALRTVGEEIAAGHLDAAAVDDLLAQMIPLAGGSGRPEASGGPPADLTRTSGAAGGSAGSP
ncbi:MAG: hypothetical protein ACLF0P_06600 [Thermoanaerobaculia bacterium]